MASTKTAPETTEPPRVVRSRSAFKAGSRTLHLKGSTFLASPMNFRIRRSLSADGEPYMNIGEMWFRKQVR